MTAELDFNSFLRFERNEFFQRRYLGSELIEFDERQLLFFRRAPREEDISATTIYQSLPLMAGIQLTRHCNLACRYCFADYTTAPAPFITVSDLEFGVKTLRTLGVMAITMTGGEPTTCPDLAKYLMVAQNVGLVTFLETNGISLLNHNLDVLRTTGCNVRLSLDSVDPKTCVALRVGKPAHVLRSIEACVQSGVPLAVRSVVTAGTLDGLIDVLGAIGSVGVCTWYVRRAVAIPGNIGPYAEPANIETEQQMIQTLVSLAANRFPEMKIKYRKQSTIGANIVLQMAQIAQLRTLSKPGREELWPLVAPVGFSLERHLRKYLRSSGLMSRDVAVLTENT